MRRCIFGWVNGSYNFRTKLSSRQTAMLSEALDICNTTKPTEFHRSIRGIKYLKFWKGTEYRTLILYTGMVVLKDYLDVEVYEHFLVLSCAVRILSNELYSKQYISIAEDLLEQYIESFIDIYGIDSISSNIHNLCHVIGDVKKFGNLTKISAYSFENFLGQFKSLLRSGNLPLSQIAKRITEFSKLNEEYREAQKYPFTRGQCQNIKHEILMCEGVFNKVYLSDNCMLANDEKNKWFMTTNNEIMAMVNTTYQKNNCFIYASVIEDKFDFFKKPFNSSNLDIYASRANLSLPKLIPVSFVKYKIFAMKQQGLTVFVPMLSF